MKRSFKSILYTLLVLPMVMLVSCEDEDKVRIPEFDIATNFRIVRDVNSFDSTDPNAGVKLTIYSESDNINIVNMYVSHFSFTANAETDQFALTELQGNNITNDGSTQLSFSLSELVEPIGLVPSDLAGGDAVNIYSIVTLDDGRVYPDTIKATTDQQFLNVTPNIINSSASTSFSPRLTFPIICELDPSFGTGEYLFEVIEGNNTGFGIPIFASSTTVTIEATSSTGRTFEVPYFAGFGFTSNVNFNFACNITLVPLTASGLGCTGTLAWDMNPNDPGTFDINDDSEFTISIIHDVLLDCGGSVPDNQPIKFRLTKQ